MEFKIDPVYEFFDAPQYYDFSKIGEEENLDTWFDNRIPSEGPKENIQFEKKGLLPDGEFDSKTPPKLRRPETPKSHKSASATTPLRSPFFSSSNDPTTPLYNKTSNVSVSKSQPEAPSSASKPSSSNNIQAAATKDPSGSSLSNLLAKLNKSTKECKTNIFSSFYDNKFPTSNQLQSTPSANTSKSAFSLSLTSPSLPEPILPLPSSEQKKEIKKPSTKLSTTSGTTKPSFLPKVITSKVTSSSSKVTSAPKSTNVSQVSRTPQTATKSSKSSVITSKVKTTSTNNQSKAKSTPSVSAVESKKKTSTTTANRTIQTQNTEVKKNEPSTAGITPVPQMNSSVSTVQEKERNGLNPIAFLKGISDTKSIIEKSNALKDKIFTTSSSATTFKNENSESKINNSQKKSGKSTISKLPTFQSFKSKKSIMSEVASDDEDENDSSIMESSMMDTSMDVSNLSINQSIDMPSSFKQKLTVPISPILNTKMRSLIRSQKKVNDEDDQQLMEIEQRKKELDMKIQQLKKDRSTTSSTSTSTSNNSSRRSSTSRSSITKPKLTTPKEIRLHTEERSKKRKMSSSSLSDSLNTSTSSSCSNTSLMSDDEEDCSFSSFRPKKKFKLSTSSYYSDDDREHRANQIWSERTLTEPKEFHFRTHERSLLRRASSAHSLSDTETTDKKKRRESFKWNGELTQPKEFTFVTAQRNSLRSSSQPKPVEENYTFKALPLNRKIFESAGEIGVPRLTKLPLTEAHSPHLRTKERAKLKKLSSSFLDENSENFENFSIFDRSKAKMNTTGNTSSFYDSSDDDDMMDFSSFTPSKKKKRASSHRKSLTEPKPFHFATEGRAALRQLQRQASNSSINDCTIPLE